MPLAAGGCTGQHFAAMQQAETSRLRVVAAAATDARRDDKPDVSDSAVPSPGRYIKEQRKRQGMSIDQLAAATKIPRSSLEFLEADQHDALPGPVFVKGFLRCCARALGVEPEEVMELVYERERELLVARRRERPTSPDMPGMEVPQTPALEAGDAAVPQADDEQAPTSTEPAPPHAAADRPSLFAGLRSAVGAGGISLMLWVVVAIFVAMVMMAAFSMLGQGSLGPT